MKLTAMIAAILMTLGLTACEDDAMRTQVKKELKEHQEKCKADPSLEECKIQNN